MTTQKGYTDLHWERMINYIENNELHTFCLRFSQDSCATHLGQGIQGSLMYRLPPLLAVVVSVRHICSAPVYRGWCCCHSRCPCPHLADEPASSLSFDAASVSPSRLPVSGYACECRCVCMFHFLFHLWLLPAYFLCVFLLALIFISSQDVIFHSAPAPATELNVTT